MADAYEIGITTAFSHVWDILRAILKSYKQADAVSFPGSKERVLMEQILKQKGAKVPSAIFAVDGSHLRCKGRNIPERRSKKYNWYANVHSLYFWDALILSISHQNNTFCHLALVLQTGYRVLAYIASWKEYLGPS